MNKTTWLGVLLVIIVVALGVYAWRAQAPTTTPRTVIATPLTTENPSATTAAINQTVQQVPDSTPSAAGTSQEGDAIDLSSDTINDVMIEITDTGFTPSTVTINAGQTVTFINNGQAPHWPASDPHPTHTNLPGFDAEHALQTGEKYSYTFNDKGSWGFHDHLNARLTGRINVQ